MTHAALRFDVLLEDGTRENVFDNAYCEVGAKSFGEACFDAIMLSNGKPCTLIYVAYGKDAKEWDIAEGDYPDFNNPDREAA